MKRILFSLLFAVCAASAAYPQLTFTINDLINVKRVADPQLSPDGRTVAFTIGIVNKDANKTLNQIYTMSIDGSSQQQITNGAGSSGSPRWSPEGKRIACKSGGQIWTRKTGGGENKQFKPMSGGAGRPESSREFR